MKNKVTRRQWNTVGATYAILVPTLLAMFIDTKRDEARWKAYEQQQEAKRKRQEQIRAERQEIQLLEEDIERFEDEKQARAKTEDPYTDEEKDLWQRMVWGEMRGQSRTAQIAIANTAENRLRYPKRYGSTLKKVLLSGEYRCMKKGNQQGKVWRAESLEPRAWQRAEEVVELVMNTEEDITSGATHYENITHGLPYWAKDIQPTLILKEKGKVLAFYDRKDN